LWPLTMRRISNAIFFLLPGPAGALNAPQSA
jgi:hypothetical protein